VIEQNWCQVKVVFKVLYYLMFIFIESAWVSVRTLCLSDTVHLQASGHSGCRPFEGRLYSH